MKLLKSATIRWESGVPVSEFFDDIYFNKDGGVAETEHVFIHGNQLIERFEQLKAFDCFTIAETGFGTGLNFLVTRQHWLKHAHPDARLHFISVEKFPLAQPDMDQIWGAWQDLADIRTSFIAQYPPAIEGFYTLFFDQGRVKLTLILGDVLSQLPELQTSVDAWFLDGFAPSKNPEMWQVSLYEHIARLSHPNATLATFTVARQVREGLSQVGFSLAKREGFGKKREMLTAWRDHLSPCASTPKPTSSVIVVGAGLAGASTARALAEQGIQVTLLESQSAPAQQGSGNAQGALYAKLAVKPTQESALHLLGLQFSTNLLKQLPPQEPPLADLCGVLQLATSEKESLRQSQLIDAQIYPASVLVPVDADEASRRIGSQTPFSGLYFPDAGWVAPADYCRYLLDHPFITTRFNQTVERLTQCGDSWTVHTHQQVFEASYVVVCTAAEAKKLSAFSHLPIKPIRGQTSQLSAHEQGPQLNTVVCGDGYISPARSGQFCFGATFDLHYHNSECRESDHQININHLAKAIPAFTGITPSDCDGRTGFRCSTADYLPLVGEAADFDLTLERFAKRRHDAKSCQDTEIPRLKGLYINVGHGSKGLITCPISAALIAAMINDLTYPLPKTLIERIDPARFILRDLSRRRI